MSSFDEYQHRRDTDGTFAEKPLGAPEVSLNAADAALELLRDERKEAMLRHWATGAAYEAANARLVAASVRAVFPNATGLTLEESDQEGSSWSPFYVIGPDSDRLEATAETDQLLDDIWTEVGDLPTGAAYIEKTGSFSARLDLEAASRAAPELATPNDIAEQAWGEDWRVRVERGDISPEGILRAIELAHKHHTASEVTE